MKSNTAISTVISVILVIIFLVVGLGAGYVAGGSGAAAHTTTSTTATTATMTTATTVIMSTTVTMSTTATTTIATINTTNIVNYWNEAAASTYGEGWWYITRVTLVSLLNANNGTYVLDVRLAPDYAAGHIPGAINIPFPNMSAAVAAGQIPQNRLIVVVCYVGESAAATMTVLRLLGYNAYDLEAGMAGWNNATRSSYEPSAIGENYPMVNGTAPGVWTTFTPTAAGDVP